LRERNEELELINDFQQDLIVEFEKVTGKELSKKWLRIIPQVAIDVNTNVH
jgi:hypothetical protein